MKNRINSFRGWGRLGWSDIIVSILLLSMTSNSAIAFDLGGLKPVNPLDNNPNTYQQVVNQPSFELKRGTLTKNAIKNQ